MLGIAALNILSMSVCHLTRRISKHHIKLLSGKKRVGKVAQNVYVESY